MGGVTRRVVYAVLGVGAAVVLGGMMLTAALFAASSATQAGAVRPSGAANAESLTVDDATVNAVAQVTGIPPMAVRGLAIVAAMVHDRTGCDVGWWLLAGVGNTESGNGTHGGASIGDDWVVRPTIGGPPLDGNGFALIYEAGAVDYAQGPFQFISSSWRFYGQDANGDGVNDVNNYLDAALAAAAHLCGSAGGPGSDLRDEATARRGVYGYNHSDAYVDTVWETAVRYRQQAGDVLAATPTGNTGGGQASEAFGVTVAASPWDGPTIGGSGNVDGLDPNFRNRLSHLAAMTQQATGGTAYVYSGFRPVEEQQAIIDNHGGVCGVWVACIDPTTGVCGSFHCKGLAADMAWTSDAADAYWHQHAAEVGLKQALDYEDWHYEPVETRGGGTG